jgi:hypothetical protein
MFFEFSQHSVILRDGFLEMEWIAVISGSTWIIDRTCDSRIFLSKSTLLFLIYI